MPAFSAVIRDICNQHGFIGANFQWMDKKLAAIIRVGIRRSVIRIRIREPGVRPIVPVATETNRPNDVGINEVGIASSIPISEIFMWIKP